MGALNAVTHELITVCNETYINADSVCELLYAISEKYAGMAVTAVLDNARCQKCRIVWELAARLNIELLYIPPYSPNLNLIERLWRFVKKKRLWSKCYDEFEQFKAVISDCLSEPDTHNTQRRAADAAHLEISDFQESSKIDGVEYILP